MVRKARNGIVYPYRVERRKRLSDGTVKIYTSYEFKVDGKTYSCKKYVDANKRLTELLQERARFGSANNSSITLGALWDSVTSYHARLNRRRVANVARCPAWNCPALSEWSTMASNPSRSRAMGLKELRMKRGLTQRELAERIGVTQQHIAAYENGVNGIDNMTLGKAIKLCDALRVRNPRKLLDSDSDSSAD